MDDPLRFPMAPPLTATSFDDGNTPKQLTMSQRPPATPYPTSQHHHNLQLPSQHPLQLPKESTLNANQQAAQKIVIRRNPERFTLQMHLQMWNNQLDDLASSKRLNTRHTPANLQPVVFLLGSWSPLPQWNSESKLSESSPLPPSHTLPLSMCWHWPNLLDHCCIHPKLNKTIIIFWSWDRQILAVFPLALAAEFPAQLSRRNKILPSLFSYMFSVFFPYSSSPSSCFDFSQATRT